MLGEKEDYGFGLPSLQSVCFCNVCHACKVFPNKNNEKLIPSFIEYSQYYR